MQIGIGKLLARDAGADRGAAQVAADEIRQIMWDFASIARTAGRLSASRLENEEETQLLALMDQMDVALKARDGGTYHKLNKTFHDLLMAITKNPRLIDLNNTIEAELSLYLRKGVYTLAQMQQSHTEHSRLVEALRNGRVTETADLFECHILTGKQRMLDTVTRSALEA